MFRVYSQPPVTLLSYFTHKLCVVVFSCLHETMNSELTGGGVELEESCIFIALYLRIQNVAVAKYFDKCLFLVLSSFL